MLHPAKWNRKLRHQTVAPYSEQFYIGGANSIRAFTVRSIGPGSYRPEDKQYGYLDETGDVKLEANVEYRFPILGDLYGAAFLDAGNVWLLREQKNEEGARTTHRRDVRFYFLTKKSCPEAFFLNYRRESAAVQLHLYLCNESIRHNRLLKNLLHLCDYLHHYTHKEHN